MLMKSIAFLKFSIPENCYYTLQFQMAFERLGLKTTVYELSEGRQRDVLTALFNDRPDCLFGVAIAGKDPILLTDGFRTDDQIMKELPLLCDHLQVPYISYQLDPPVNFKHYCHSDYLVYGHFDRLICKTLRDSVLKKVTCIPYAVDYHLLDLPPLDKKYPIVFMGSFYDIELVEKLWKQRYSKKLIQQMLDIVQHLQNDPYLHLMQAMNDLWDLEEKNAAEVYCQIELYLRSIERWELVKAFSDYPLHIFGGPIAIGNHHGRSWKKALKGTNVIVHDVVKYLPSLEIMRQTHVLLNSCPVFIGGTHDRVMNGLACRAMVVTNCNEHTQELFGHNKGVGYFRMHQWDTIRHHVDYWLKHPEVCNDQIKSAHSILKQNHTWDHRAQSLLQEMSCHLSRS
ncbi:MAG: glycosyltransferase [Parachlamydiales bacterium]|nr:glycosyltransferase [Parachlamydiales bacterium]